MQQNYNKKNKGLALIGQGRWKHALKFSLLLVGFVMGFGMMGAYAQTPEGGLYMHKTWVPDYDNCPTGDCGYIRLETFVTGEKIITETHVPTDIVLVLDVSGSMNDNISTYSYTARNSQAYSYSTYGNNTYYYLYNGEYYAVQRARLNNQGNTSNTGRNRVLRFQVNGTWYYLSGTGVTTTMPTNYNSNNATIWTGVLYTRATVSSQSKLSALQEAVCTFVDNIADDAVEYQVEHRISIVKYAMNAFYGSESSLTEGNHLNAPYNGQNVAEYNYTEVVINRGNPRTNATNIKNAVNGLTAGGATAADYGMNKARYLLASIPEEELEGRSKVVVMFTDGSPTYQSNFSNDVANSTIGYAYDLKHSADDLLAPYNGQEYQFDARVFTIGVFDNETDQIHTYMGRTSSNFPDAQTMTNTCVQDSDAFYYKAESAEGLSSIFESIAQESGGSAYDLGSETVVQDVIAPSFQLDIPSGQTAATTIKAYAPKCNGKDGNMFTFEPETDGATRLQMGTDEHGNVGVVVGGGENRLPDGVVDYDPDTKTLTFDGFNFSAMYVAQEVDGHGQPLDVYIGRKLVMLIPLVVEEGTWGDDMVTNGPLSIIQPNGDTLNPLYFNIPTANVIGTVWTEVITEEPDGFELDNIDTPEELAWFISWVNGRERYKDNSDVESHPNANARITADIDMSAHNWVSIGEGTDGYTGTFDGNGHVITGLKNNATKYYKLNERAMVYPGMFSNVKGTVKNLFVLDADFRAKNHILNPTDEFKTFMHFGIIADTLSTGGQIFNCEAAGRITCNTNIDNLERDSQMIFGGLVGYNNGGTIHSTMTMAELTGYTLGGAVGLNSGSFSNSFTNGVYNYMDNGVTGKYVGGIAAQNTGTINNCYVRFERDNTNLNKLGNGFGMLVGNGTAPTACYTPQIVTWSRPDFASTTTAINTNTTVPTTAVAPGDNPSTSYTLSVTPTFYNMFTNDNMTGGTWGTLGTYNVYNNGTPLLDMLNEGKGNGASWKRTTAGAYSEGAGDINDDYPVLVFDEYTCVGSADGIRLDYAASLNEMLHRHNNGNMNENTSLADSYKKTNHEAVYKGTINLYANDDVTLEQQTGDKDVADNSTAEGVVVYIDENISLLQDATSNIEAYTGQTLKAFGIVQGNPQAGDRWHNVSSSLSNSEFGWDYLCDSIEPTQVAHNFESDPCGWHLNNHDEDHALFPIDMSSYHRGDFYCFYEPEYHWLNFRRNSLSHWHMDNYDLNIPYTNEEYFIPGKGYLLAVDMSTWASYGREAQFLQNRGTLNNGEVEIDVTADAPDWTGLKGYNLLGNPYQSYLDFTTFAWANSGLWSDPSEMTFAIYDPESGKYVQGLAGEQPSEGALATTGDINMHQGFLIRVSNGGPATFTNDMRHNDPASGTHFRGGRVNYPVINLIATDRKGNTDVAVLEVGRPENAGGEKLRVGSATGRISLRHDNNDFGILFRDMNEGSQPLYFNAEEDGTFTLSWNTANANFSSLTLVDNITGVKYDMLAHDSYEFEGRASDYKSRFKILVGEFTDIEENEETVSDNFAFFDGSDWVVNGQGQLMVTDVMGRTVYTGSLTNDQNRVSLNGLSQGVYLMQVLNANGAMVQKIVVR